MLRFSLKSSLILFFYFAISVRCAHEALVFTRNQFRWVYDVEKIAKSGYPPIPSPTATACPAEKSSPQQAFNEKHSLSKNSLFVRDTYETSQGTKDIVYDICETPYKMSVLYHTISVELQFGFEMYYDKTKFAGKNFVDSKRWHYDSITNTHSKANYVMPILSRVPNVPVPAALGSLGRLVPTPVTSAVTKISQYPTRLNLDDKTELGFLWKSAFYSKFNFRSKRTAQVVYNLIPANGAVYECDDWDLGKEYYTGVGISPDDFYTDDNQEKMLKNIKLPEWKPQDDNENVEDASCESGYKCFAKWLSLPIEQFNFLATKPASCSYLLAVPIWRSTVKDLLEKLDNFLGSVLKVISAPTGSILIHSGVHGDLRLPTNTRKQSLKTITLTEKTIPVPNVIYKLVKFNQTVCKEKTSENDKTKDGDNDDEADVESEGGDSAGDDENDELPEKITDCFTREAAMIAVVHNDPNFNPAKDKICEDLCEDWGWDEIQMREVDGKRFKSKYVYCCNASDTQVRKKLGINNDKSAEEIAPFALKFLFVPNPDEMNFHEVRDIRRSVVKEYKKLFEGAEAEPSENYENEIEVMKFDRSGMQSFKIPQPRHDKDEPEKSETELVDDRENKTEKPSN